MKYGLVKEILIALVLLSLIVGNTWDAEATQRVTRQTKHNAYSDVKVREKRFSNPFTSFVSIWNALGHMYRLFVEVRRLI